MKTKHSAKIETVKNAIVAAIKGTGDIVCKTIHGVKVVAKEPEAPLLSNN